MKKIQENYQEIQFYLNNQNNLAILNNNFSKIIMFLIININTKRLEKNLKIWGTSNKKTPYYNKNRPFHLIGLLN